jgi:hypothetical protein
MRNLALWLLPLLLTVDALAADAASGTARAVPSGADAATEADDGQAAPAARPARRASTRAFRPVLETGVDKLMLEAGALPDAPEADMISALSASAYVLWQPQREWEFRGGLRVDAAVQRGGALSYSDWEADFGETYARWRSGDTRLTVGAQTVIWGRVDEIPLADRVSRADLMRFALDDLPDRRLAQMALRWEQAIGDYKLDAVALPAFRGARLPDDRSVWSPINRLTGEIIGIAPNPQLAAIARNAAIVQDDGGGGGAALRLTRTGVAPVDFGLTLARTRQSLPYFRVDGGGATLTATHPYNTFAGADVEFVTGDLTWRSELGYTDDVPVTLPGGVPQSTSALEWLGAVEFFPGGKDTRLNLQLAARKLRTSDVILELDQYVALGGEVESTLDQGRWALALRFSVGLNVRDVYLAPKVSYLGWEPHELYVVGRYFDGEERTFGGFHRDHGMVAVGIRTRF